MNVSAIALIPEFRQVETDKEEGQISVELDVKTLPIVQCKNCMYRHKLAEKEQKRYGQEFGCNLEGGMHRGSWFCAGGIEGDPEKG